MAVFCPESSSSTFTERGTPQLGSGSGAVWVCQDLVRGVCCCSGGLAVSMAAVATHQVLSWCPSPVDVVEATSFALRRARGQCCPGAAVAW